MESSKNKKIGGWILALFALLSGATYGGGQLYGGTGVGTADQWTATTTPNAGITQRIYGKDLILSGLESADCLGTNSGGVVVDNSGSCGGGVGSSFAYPFPGNATSTTLTFSGGLVSNGSTTIAGLTSGFVGNNNGKLYGFATSSLNLPNSALQNSSVTINTSGGLSGGGAVSLGGTLNLSSFSYPFPSSATSSALTLSGLLTISNSSTTLASFGYASSTKQVIGTLTFGGVTGTAWSDFCTSITGSAGLCDGDDATGAGGGITTLGPTGQGQTGSTQTLATSTNGTDFTITASGNTQTFNLPVASASNTGKLSATDWSTFNSKESALTFNWPLIRSTNTISWGGISTSSAIAAGANVLYATGVNTFASAATGTVSAGSSAITVTANRYVIGGSLAIDCAGASASQNGCLSSTDWSTFNNKIGWGQATSTSPNQFVYTNALGKLVSVASSSLSLPNTALQNSTISGISLGSNLADLTATNGTLTFSGTYNGSTARSIGINLANANTWTALQQFSNATSTLFSSTYASTTNQVIGNNLTFGGVTGSAWSTFCTSITGSAALCDGDDATGGGSGVTASTTASVVIYTNAASSNYYAYNASTTVTTSNTDFDALLQAQVNLFDDCAAVDKTCLGGKIFIMRGNYYVDTAVTINGNDNGGDFDSGSVIIEGEGQDATRIIVNNNAAFLDFDHAAMPKVRNLSVYIKGSANGFVSDSATNNARAVWNFEFTNIHVSATTTSTGAAFDLGNAFRGTFTNIEGFGLHNCFIFRAEGAFNPGDFNFTRSFCEMDSASGAITFQFLRAGTGFMNQMHFDTVEGIANGSSATFVYGEDLAWTTWTNLNAEEYDVLVDLKGVTDAAVHNVFHFNYTSLRNGVANLRGCRFWASASGNVCDFGFLNTSANATVVDDMNTNTGNPNVIMGYIGADAGTASASTSASTVTIYRDISGYGTMDTNLSPGARLGTWQFFGDLIARGTAAFVNLANAIGLIIPTGTSHTNTAAGDLYFDTTDNQLQIGTSTAATARAIPTITKLWSGTIASTSVDFASGGRIPLPAHRDAVVITEIDCNVDGGTSKVIGISSLAGSADTDTVTCATTNTADTSMSANYDISAARLNSLEMGATTGSVDYVTFSVWGYVKTE